MIKISKADYKMRLTKRDEINIDDLTEEHLSIYLAMYSLYMEWIINLLIIKTNIKVIDLEFNKTELNFKKIREDKLDFYQKFSAEYLDYFYVRNNLYLSRLNKQEFDFMIKRIKSDNYVFDDDVENFILKTYKKVIYEKVEGISNVKINHDKYNFGRLVYNNSIIIGFRYDTNNNIEGKSWYNNLIKQELFIKNKSKILLENIHDYFQWTVTLLDYK